MTKTRVQRRLNNGRGIGNHAEGGLDNGADRLLLRLARSLATRILNLARAQPPDSTPDRDLTIEALLDSGVWRAGTIICPRCGALYAAEESPDEAIAELEERELDAIGQLAAECPVHRADFIAGV